MAFREYDFDLALKVIEEGKGLILVVNKWDLVVEEWKDKAAKYMMKQVSNGLGIVKKVPLHFISSSEGTRVQNVLDEVLNVYDKWNTRASTNLLNQWVQKFKNTHKIPNQGQKHLHLLYMNQIKSRPPTFVAFVNYHNLVTHQYEKFVRNSLSEEFEMAGVGVRVHFRGLKYFLFLLFIIYL